MHVCMAGLFSCGSRGRLLSRQRLHRRIATNAGLLHLLCVYPDDLKTDEKIM